MCRPRTGCINGVWWRPWFALAAIYVLGERQRSLAVPSIEAIIPQIGLMHLITHRYPQSLKLERDMRSREFALLGRLANIVPIRQLHREDSLSEVCEVQSILK
jgi:hypothetical protein